VYLQLLSGAGVKVLNGYARLLDAHTVEVDVLADGRIDRNALPPKTSSS